MRNVRYIFFVIKFEIHAPQGSDHHQYKKEVKLRKEIIIIIKKDDASRYVNAFSNSSSFTSVEGKGFKKNKRHPKPLSLFTHFLFVISQSNNTHTFPCPQTLNVYKRKENHMTLVVNSTESLTCRVGKYKKNKTGALCCHC